MIWECYKAVEFQLRLLTKGRLIFQAELEMHFSTTVRVVGLKMYSVAQLLTTNLAAQFSVSSIQ